MIIVRWKFNNGYYVAEKFPQKLKLSEILENKITWFTKTVNFIA